MMKKITLALAASLAASLAVPALAEDFDTLLRAVEAADVKCGKDIRLCVAKRELAEMKKSTAEAVQRKKLAAEAAQAAGRPVGTIRPGDSPEYVELQWGKPTKVDRMAYAGGVDEWWWYAGNAVHFSGGVVETIHTSERKPR